MRKIKRWKQGIAVAGVIALTGSLLAGCGGADGKNSGSKGETGSSNQAGNADTADLVNVNTDNSDGKKTKDESAKAMGRFLENDLTVQQITVIMQQILQIMEKPGRMEKVWKNCWGLRRIWENISALFLQQRMEVYLSGQICLLTGTMKMHRQQPTVGKRILRMTT